MRLAHERSEFENEAYFEKYVTLKKPIEVKLGDGRFLQATKIGDVNVTFDVLGKPSEVNIKNFIM